jgi:hypothetical protein
VNTGATGTQGVQGFTGLAGFAVWTGAQGVAGVTEVEVDLAAGAARVVGDFSKGTAALTDVLNEEGYPAQVKN